MSKGWLSVGFLVVLGALFSVGATYVPPEGGARDLPVSLQEASSISGNLLEEIGPGRVRAIRGATVNLAGEGLDLTRTTGSDGRYVFSGLADGTYTVAVTSFPPDRVRPLGDLATTIPIDGSSVSHHFHFYPTVVTVDIDPLLEVLHITPNPLYIVPGQSVRWVLDSPEPEPGAFTVHFNPISPLMYRRKMAEAGDTVIDAQVRRRIFPGKYSYFVAVEYQGRIFTEDPELIDENGDEQNPGDSVGGGGGQGED